MIYVVILLTLFRMSRQVAILVKARIVDSIGTCNILPSTPRGPTLDGDDDDDDELNGGVIPLAANVGDGMGVGRLLP